MTDGVDEIGAVQRVEVKIVDAPGHEAEHLFGGDGSGNEIARLLVVLQSLESMAEPVRHMRARFGGEARDLLEIVDGNDAGHDGNVDTAGADAIEVTVEQFVLEEELRDRGRGAGIDLGFEHIDIGVDARRLRVLLGVAADGNLERGDTLGAFDEVGGVDVAALRRLVAFADSSGRIAAERHDVPHAEIPIIADDAVNLLASGGDAGEMGGRVQRRLAQHARNRGVGALAGRAAGAIGYGDIARSEWLEAADRAPQRLFHRLALRRKELERHIDRAATQQAALGFGCEHQAAASTLAFVLRFLAASAGFTPSHRDTVSLPPEGAGFSSRKRSSLSPELSNRRAS